MLLSRICIIRKHNRLRNEIYNHLGVFIKCASARHIFYLTDHQNKANPETHSCSNSSPVGKRASPAPSTPPGCRGSTGMVRTSPPWPPRLGKGPDGRDRRVSPDLTAMCGRGLQREHHGGKRRQNGAASAFLNTWLPLLSGWLTRLDLKHSPVRVVVRQPFLGHQAANVAS